MLLTTLDCNCPGVPVSDLLHDEERDDALLRAATIGSVQGTRGWGSDPRLILPAVRSKLWSNCNCAVIAVSKCI